MLPRAVLRHDRSGVFAGGRGGADRPHLPAAYFLTISRGVFSKALSFSGLQASFWPLLLSVPVILWRRGLLKKQET